MMHRILIILVVGTILFGCKKSTEAEPDENPLSGTWILELITDDLNNYIGDSQGIDGAIVRMDFNSDGKGEANILNGSQTITYSTTWSSTEDQLVINIEGRGELIQNYEIVSGQNKSKDEGPASISLILSGNNQFAGYPDISLVFYYIKS
jgi:hypothetical protein